MSSIVLVTDFVSNVPLMDATSITVMIIDLVDVPQMAETVYSPAVAVLIE